MKFTLLVLSAVMSMKTVQGCTEKIQDAIGRTAPVNWATAFEDMAQRGDRAIPEMGLPISGQNPRFMPSLERTIDQPEPGL